MDFNSWRARNGYRAKILATNIVWISISIVIGLFIISLLETAYDIYLKAPLSPSFIATPDNWNTIRAIWVAEVPLAFLLRWLFGSLRLEHKEELQRLFENTMDALKVHGMDDYEHLKHLSAYKLYPIRKEQGRVIQLIANAHTKKVYWMDTRISTIGENEVIEYDQNVNGKTLDDLLAYVNSKMKTDFSFVPKNAKVADLV